MQDDTDVQKILPIGKSWMALTAGDAARCDAIVRRVAERVLTVGQSIADSANKMLMCLNEEYHLLRDELLEQQVLAPKMLTRQLWAARSSSLLPLPHSVVGGIEAEIREFRVGVDLLVCGFDKHTKANILALNGSGEATNQTNEGFGSVGSGSEVATGRLLWQGFRRKAPLSRVLYAVFDAKAHSEQILGVGYEWDCWIMVAGKPRRKLKRSIANLIEDVFEDATKSPFETKGRKPTRWKQRLETYCRDVMKVATGHASG